MNQALHTSVAIEAEELKPWSSAPPTDDLYKLIWVEGLFMEFISPGGGLRKAFAISVVCITVRLLKSRLSSNAAIKMMRYMVPDDSLVLVIKLNRARTTRSQF